LTNEAEHKGPETTPEPPNRRRSKGRLALKLVAGVVALLLLACAGAALVAFLAYQHITEPGVAGEAVNVTIPEGATGRDVARILAQQGLVEYEVLFLAAIRLDKSREPLKQGWYALPRGSSPMELLHMLQQGSNRRPEPFEIPDDLKVTVPEGLSIVQMAQQFPDPGAFIAAASDPELIARLGIKAKTLEGFLMPNTYYFEKRPSERDVIERMVAEFKKTYAALVKECPPPEGRDKLGIITVASLVEEEIRAPEERSKVAAVIYNRLTKGMPLQLDSTLQYALNKYGQRILYDDREVDSPYNTYENPGLPPGPISSPGSDSIKAALQPADADYLYFVSNADGKTHTFSSDEADHLRAVNHFRKDIAPQRKSLEEADKKDRPQS